MGGQCAPDTVVHNVSVKHRSGRRWLGARFPGPADPRDHDVRVLLLRQVDQPPQRVRTEEVVCIVKEDINTGGFGQTAIAPCAGTSGVRLLEDLEVGSHALQLTETAPGVVGRTVVDNDDLDQMRRQTLTGERIQCLPQQWAGVVGRDDDRHRGGRPSGVPLLGNRLWVGQAHHGVRLHRFEPRRRAPRYTPAAAKPSSKGTDRTMGSAPWAVNVDRLATATSTSGLISNSSLPATVLPNGTMTTYAAKWPELTACNSQESFRLSPGSKDSCWLRLGDQSSGST